MNKVLRGLNPCIGEILRYHFYGQFPVNYYQRVNAQHVLSWTPIWVDILRNSLVWLDLELRLGSKNFLRSFRFGRRSVCAGCNKEYKRSVVSLPPQNIFGEVYRLTTYRDIVCTLGSPHMSKYIYKHI